jgi:hypothetical protein
MDARLSDEQELTRETALQLASRLGPSAPGELPAKGDGKITIGALGCGAGGAPDRPGRSGRERRALGDRDAGRRAGARARGRPGAMLVVFLVLLVSDIAGLTDVFSFVKKPGQR